MELTKEHFDKILTGLATKDDLKAVKSDVAAIKAGMVNLATQKSVDDLSKTVAQIKLTQDNHTMVLGQMVTEKKKKEDKKVISEDRFERLEH